MPSPSPEETQLNIQGYNIVTIIKRLESATSRLEDITIFQEEANRALANNSTTAGSSDDVASPSNKVAAVASASDISDLPTVAVPKFVGEFESLVKEHVEPFVSASTAIDPVLGSAATLLKEAFVAQAQFLKNVSQAKKPQVSDPAFAEALGPTNTKIMEIASLKDANRRSEFFNHLNTVAEGSPVLGWVVTDTPVSFIPEFKDSAQFWSNRVLKEYKEKDPKHGEWVAAFMSIFDALRAYVKEYHTTGPSWNAQGKSLADVLAGPTKPAESAEPKAPAAGGPPPPPPAPPANLYDEPEAGPGGLTAVFADLNKGSDVTSGLKKVDKSQMTHKNPELRKQGAISKKPPPPKKPTSLSSSSSVPKKKPARKELVDGTKWIIENFTEADASEPIVIEVEKNQSVFIGKTSGITVQIKGKGNAVSISETSKTGVVVDSLISGIDVIKSFKFGIQVTGVVPLISTDKCEEGSIYLSQESIDANSQIVSSNTTALNVNVLEGEDYVELAVPEQLSHTIKNGKLVSEVVEHAG